MVADEAGVTWGTVLTAATQVSILLAALAGAYAGLRRWVQRTAGVAKTAAEAAATQVATSNGKTLGQLVERTATQEQVEQLRAELSVLDGWSGEARQAAREALAVAQRSEWRLDAHLAGHETREQT